MQGRGIGLRKYKKRKATVRLSNNEKVFIDRDEMTVEFRGRTIHLDKVVDALNGVVNHNNVVVIKLEDDKITTRVIEEVK